MPKPLTTSPAAPSLTSSAPDPFAAAAGPQAPEQEGSQPTKPIGGVDIAAFRKTEDAQKLASWVKSEFDKAKTARRQKELQWYVNMSMALGNQWAKATQLKTDSGTITKMIRPKLPWFKERRVINKTRSFIRWEHSKFISNTPSIVSVPGTGTDEDVRSSYAAEQVWESVSASKGLRKHYASAAWWMIVTGNGFIKVDWDKFANTTDGDVGDIRFANVTPFHIFVPDLREVEIEDQPFVIFAYTKQAQWVNQFWAQELDGIEIKPTMNSASLIDDAYLNLQKQSDTDSVRIYEVWVKPGGCPMLPNGGVVTMVEDTLLGVYDQGLPYGHGRYPITHFRHLETGGFYADSPLVDLNQLQREYNGLRSTISENARRTGNGQFMYAEGSIVMSKWTNEPGAGLPYKQGFNPPTPITPPQLPSYMIAQQDRIQADWDELAGTNDISTGQAPPGVSAGTAISYLQEAANRYHTVQYQNIELGFQNIARQALNLFNEYVEFPRRIKVIGADGAFDSTLLAGSDVSNGLDVRVEANSAAPTTQAAVRAQAMDLFSMRLIDGGTALKMMDMNGYQRAQDVLKVAERKAQRENIKMKSLDPMDVEGAAMQNTEQVKAQAAQDPQGALAQGLDPANPDAPIPTVMIPVDDFDNHQLHITIHNAFRMGQEYEILDDQVKQQFAMHVAMHQHYLQQAMMQQTLNAIPLDPSEGGAPPEEQGAPGGGSPAGPPSGAPGQEGS